MKRKTNSKGYDWSGGSFPKYNPKVEGYGNPDNWRSDFRFCMGLDEAVAVVGTDSPWSILGLAVGATLLEVKRAYRKLAQQYHPDKYEKYRESEPERYTEAEIMFKRINAAYVILTK